MNIRRATEEDLAALSDLCLRSKAVWGYDADFMAACREELTLTRKDLAESSLALAERNGMPVAMVQVTLEEEAAGMHKLFVDPGAIGGGYGRAMFDWALEEAKHLGASRVLIESDPNAKPFYEKMGAKVIGSVPSESIAGRELPLLSVDLT